MEFTCLLIMFVSLRSWNGNESESDTYDNDRIDEKNISLHVGLDDDDDEGCDDDEESDDEDIAVTQK